MKFSARTIQILRNFASINQSLIFNPGNTLITMAPKGTVVARATIDTEITDRFAIYDLPAFLSSMSMFVEPELKVNKHFIDITEGKERMRAALAEPSLIEEPPSKYVHLDNPEVTFTLPNDTLSRSIKALSIIGAPEIAIRGDGKKIYLEALDTKEEAHPNYRSEIGTTDKTFRFILHADNMKILPGDYEVFISKDGISHFKGTDVEVWIAVEHNSSYEG